MSDLHKNDPYSPYADDLEFVRDYARRNDGYPLVQPVVDFINAHLAQRMIRTVEELRELDPDTVVLNSSGDARTVGETITQYQYRTIYYAILPAVVITPADQVRAARKALEEA